MDGDFKKEVIDRSIEDIKVEFDEEFDRNFERKAFFDEKEWPERKFDRRAAPEYPEPETAGRTGLFVFPAIRPDS